MSIKSISKYKLIIVTIILFVLNVLVYTFIIKDQGIYSLKDLAVGPSVDRTCKDCNVIIVTLDTLSSNHIRCYGYFRNTAPNLCKFAENNVFFTNAYSNASWTMPSHVSFFTGLLPHKAGVNDYFDKLSSDKILLPELLKSLGYNSMLFFPANNPSLPIDDVYGRLGDSLYDNNVIKWEESIDMFKESVRNKKRTFMFLHTYDVHEPFLIGRGREQIYPPKIEGLPTNWYDFIKVDWTPEFTEYMVNQIRRGVDSQWDWQKAREDAEVLFPELLAAYPDYEKEVEVLKKIEQTGMLWNYIFDQNYTRFIDKQNPEHMKALSGLYDQTIQILDEEKIPLLTKLVEDPEFKDNTILIILGDHGEEFMEHGHLYHETVYNSNMRVPLIMHIPGVSGRKVVEPVQLLDIFPTLDELLNLNSKIKFDGNSLVKRIFGLDRSNKLIILEGRLLLTKAFVYGPWKMLLSKQEDNTYLPYELYNLDKDPNETKNILFNHNFIKDQLLNEYKRFVDKQY